MKNILVPILCFMLLVVCIPLGGCDIYKKYDNEDIEKAYKETYNDENLAQFFDSTDDYNFKIEWSQGVRNEFNNTNSLFKKLDTIYFPILKGAFDSFYSIKDRITDEWALRDSTAVYNALANFRDSLKKFADKKESFESSIGDYTTGATLTTIQKNHYDILVEYFQDLISKSISLGKKTVQGVMKNNYKDFYSLEEFNKISSNNNAVWVYLKNYANLMRINLVQIAFNFDIKISYINSDRNFLFNTEITPKIKNLNNLIQAKRDKVRAQGFTTTESMKEKIIAGISNHTQMESNISNYMRLLNKLNVRKLQSHKENIPEYIASLSVSEQNDYQLIWDFNNYEFTYMLGNITSILNEI